MSPAKRPVAAPIGPGLAKAKPSARGELAAIVAKQRALPRRPAGLGRIDIVLPIKTVSEANGRFMTARGARAKWARTARQRAEVRNLLNARIGIGPPELPVEIKLTRIAPRRLDRLENLGGALKAVKDGVADYLGCRNDEGPEISWLPHGQEKGRVREYAVRIQMATKGRDDGQ